MSDLQNLARSLPWPLDEVGVEVFDLLLDNEAAVRYPNFSCCC